MQEIHAFDYSYLKPYGLKNCSINFVSTLYTVVKEHGPTKTKEYEERVVGRTGLEPVTPALSRRCSNQLSYMPVIPSMFHLELVEVRRLELLTSSLQS